MLKLLREIEPELSVSWETRDMITIRVDGVSRAWCFCRTKDAEALDWRFVIKRGAVNLARVEGIGEVEVVSSRADGDVLRVRLKDLNAEQAGRLKEVLAETLEGFREMFAREKAG
jgi:excinuclease ABC subunit A